MFPPKHNPLEEEEEVKEEEKPAAPTSCKEDAAEKQADIAEPETPDNLPPTEVKGSVFLSPTPSSKKEVHDVTESNDCVFLTGGSVSAC